MTVLYGAAAVAVLWWILHSFAHTNATAIAKVIRIVGGVLALSLAVLLGLRGRIDIAIMLGGLAAWLLGWSGLGIPAFGRRTQRTSGSRSRVRSVLLEMELDHDTRTMSGAILAGAFTGQQLDSLDEAGLQRLLAECRAKDPDGVRLLEAYLDRRFPQWRESAYGNGHEQPEQSPSGAMTDDEAYQILGLAPGASLDTIQQAHRTLMKKLHPDQGGSTYLAARVNQAKEVLLRRHR